MRKSFSNGKTPAMTVQLGRLPRKSIGFGQGCPYAECKQHGCVQGIFSLSHWRQCAGTYRLPFAGGPVVLVFPCLLHDGWSSVLSWKEVNGKPQVTSMNSVRGIIQQSWIQKNEEMPSPINILTQSTPKNVRPFVRPPLCTATRFTRPSWEK